MFLWSGDERPASFSLAMVVHYFSKNSGISCSFTFWFQFLWSWEVVACEVLARLHGRHNVSNLTFQPSRLISSLWSVFWKRWKLERHYSEDLPAITNDFLFHVLCLRGNRLWSLEAKDPEAGCWMITKEKKERDHSSLESPLNRRAGARVFFTSRLSVSPRPFSNLWFIALKHKE